MFVTCSRLLASASLAAALVSAGVAQNTIATGAAPSGLARSMNNNDNAIALTADGMLWSVIYVMDAQGSGGHLQLRRSVGHGRVWLAVDTFPLPNNTAHNNHHNNSGCIVAGRDGDRLHVAWADKTAATTYWSAMYQAFDTKTLMWVGQPTLLAKGTSANNHFWPVDIDMTPKGTLAICISGHRAGGLGLGAWDCGLAIKKPGGQFNAQLYNLRNGGQPYSQNACIVAVDETIHCVMKNNLGAYGMCYRSYDTEANSWDQTQQVPVSPNNNSGIAAGNKSVIAADASGGLYILYMTGNASRPRTIRLAYAKPGTGSLNADWKDITVVPDTATVGTNYRSVASNAGDYPQITGGNTTKRCYSLSPEAGGGMAVLYSKPFETFANLFYATFKDGNAQVPEVKLSGAGTKPYSFEWISGLHTGDHSFVSTWTTYGKTDAPPPNNGTFPNGKVDFWITGGSVGRTVAFGRGCQGQLTRRPRMHASGSRPSLGSAYNIEMDRFPANASFFLAVGTSITLPPLDLAFLGAPTCQLNTSFPLIVPLSVNVSGELTLTWNVPNDARLSGTSLFTQCFVKAPNSTPGGVVTTNALSSVLGK